MYTEKKSNHYRKINISSSLIWGLFCVGVNNNCWHNWFTFVKGGIDLGARGKQAA